jgi:hypothetical protein
MSSRSKLSVMATEGYGTLGSHLGAMGRFRTEGDTISDDLAVFSPERFLPERLIRVTRFCEAFVRDP